VQITVSNRQKKLRVSAALVKKIITSVREGERRRKSPSQVSVSFVTDSEISRLNLRFHHTPGPTDVLAFDLGRCADIVVSADTAARNARLFKTTARSEIRLYVIHGMLHLLGYDDSTAAREWLMRRKENEYMKPWL
jgi:rRNA maturation RNase YbeY